MIGFIEEKLQILQAKLHRKGQERLTLMVIPHGQDRIFSLQLTWLMVLFLSATVTAVFALTVWAWYHQSEKQREIERLKELYGANYNAAITLKRSADQVAAQRRELRQRLLEISNLLHVDSRDMPPLPDESKILAEIERDLHNEALQRIDIRPGTRYLSPIYTMELLYHTKEREQPLLVSVDSFIREAFGVYQRMPLGRPVRPSGAVRDTSGFGVRVNPINRVGVEFHSGFDIAGPIGTPIYATGDGVVHRVLRFDPGYGNAVIIRHNFGFYSLYAHMTRIDVRPEQEIFARTQLGTMGRTGRVTGTHLHYEIWRQENKRINPLSYICSRDLTTPTCRRFHRSESEQ